MSNTSNHYKIDNATLRVAHANLFSRLGPFSKSYRNLRTDLAVTGIDPNHEDPEYCPPHHHDFFQLLYTNTDVPCRHLLKNKNFTTRRGDIALIPMAFAHHISVCKPDVSAGYMFNMRYEYVFFSASEQVRNFLFDWAYLLRWIRGDDVSTVIFNLNESELESADNLCRKIFDAEMKVRDFSVITVPEIPRDALEPLYRTADEFMHVLMAAFYRSCTERELKLFEKYRAILLPALQFIHTNYGTQISLADVCRSSGLKISRLSQLFRDIIGLTVNDYINFIRTSHARALIADTSMSLTQIGKLCGFSGQTHFGRVFKNFSGCTPRLYKTEHSFDRG